MSATATRTRAAAARRAADPQRKLLLLVGVGIALFLLYFPTRQLFTEHARIARLETRLAALKAENDQLSKQVRRLQDPGELELLARERLGLVKPGEKAYLLVPQRTPAPADVPASRGAPFWSRWWNRFLTMLKGSS